MFSTAFARSSGNGFILVVAVEQHDDDADDADDPAGGYQMQLAIAIVV